MKTALVLLLAACAAFAIAGPRDSVNYSILTDTLDYGGVAASSTNYQNDGSVGSISGISDALFGTDMLKSGYIAQLDDPNTPLTLNISGVVTYCSNPILRPVPGVTMTQTGTSGNVELTDASGDYSLTALTSGGSYVVTPTKAALTPGVDGIDGADVVAVVRHFLEFPPPIPAGCQLDAADADTQAVGISGADVVAILRFYLGFPNTATSRVGEYRFTPAGRSYLGLVSNQIGQDYDALIYGDVTGSFVHRPERGVPPNAAGNGADASEGASTVAAVALPEEVAANQVRSQVTTTTIGVENKLVGFQGNITFDERVVAFDESRPVQAAGLTAGNWNVSGHVLPGTGPIRTLRLMGYSNDFTPLSGEGTLFELRMTRVSRAAEAAPLNWAAPPHQFLFIDADSRMQPPGNVTSRPSQR